MMIQKEKKSKKNKHNQEDVKESKHAVNVVVENDEGVSGNDVMKKKKKKKKKKTKEKATMGIDAGDLDSGKRVGEEEDVLEEDNVVLETNDIDKGETDKNMNKEKEKKKKKKVRIYTEDGGTEGMKGIEDGGIMNQSGNEEVMEDVDKKKKGIDKGDMSSGQQDSSVCKATDSGKEDGMCLEMSGEACVGKSKDKIERKKRKKDKGQSRDLEGVGVTGEGSDMDKVERKKRKKEKGRRVNDLESEREDTVANNLAYAAGSMCSTENLKQSADTNKKTKGKRKMANSEKEGSDNPKPKKRKKKVTFSGHVEVFPSSADPESQASNKDGEVKLVQGKRFTPEEDKIIQEAVSTYIQEHGLGEDGLKMVLNCRSHREVKGCWKHIALALPYRPREAIYYRAQVLYRRGTKRKWTQEEYEELRKHQEKHGNQWKALAEEFGKHRFHIKDTWRRIKFLNRKKGHWSQDEYQNLFDLVNTDLQLKLSEEKKSKHGMLRDNIHWSAISEKLTTRADASCCLKWYNQLTSPMVAEGNWSDTDDYRLINELYSLDPNCLEDVDWDNLLEHRSGDVCRKRWNQMVLHIGQHATKSFAEQVEILAGRYCPHLIEVREDWDNKPYVDS